ncbi:MAG: protease inhibitor I42 family protein [Anaerolineales bacterium]|nr:protease inhibitor I42 family protein [Anaerolineales bacterium]MDP2976212.1 protease inhibitor I42 family protein [Anaerolineales bacterium]MDP3186579.1 protease inhibitor I42 family protein [Anaerolineales bacterium]
MFRKFQILMFVAVLVVLFLISAGCGPKQAKLTGADNGKSVTSNAGETLVIELGANPSTGFSWEVSELDTAILAQVGEFEYHGTSIVPMPGSGGTQTLTLKALQPGQTTVTLIYHRSWEKDVPPAEAFTIQVTVK